MFERKKISRRKQSSVGYFTIVSKLWYSEYICVCHLSYCPGDQDFPEITWFQIFCPIFLISHLGILSGFGRKYSVRGICSGNSVVGRSPACSKETVSFQSTGSRSREQEQQSTVVGAVPGDRSYSDCDLGGDIENVILFLRVLGSK